ncbi:MAG TPA: DNA-binding protein Alba [Methanocorpusculum sp.]|nr:DNA-binding protein Alba [Methanocorpusculum sp.]
MDDKVVLVGTKPVMNYVLAVVTIFNSGKKEVIVKARGKAITRAVDAVEIVVRQFLTDVVKEKVSIGTESVDSDNGPSNISSIEIVLSRK